MIFLLFLLERKYFYMWFLDQPEQCLKKHRIKQTKIRKQNKNKHKQTTYIHITKKKITCSLPALAYSYFPSGYAGQTCHWAKHITSRGRRQFNVESWLFHMVSQMENHKTGWGFTAKQNSLEKGENICMDAYIKSSSRKSVRHLENDRQWRISFHIFSNQNFALETIL